MAVEGDAREIGSMDVGGCFATVKRAVGRLRGSHHSDTLHPQAAS